MRILTYNVNGIRAAMKKGFVQWLATYPADVVCLQEVKAKPTDADFSGIEELGYQLFWYPAEKPGYSGVAIFTKVPPTQVIYGDGRNQSDAEGRVIRADFGDLTVICAYFPSGTSGEHRQIYKYQWLDEFFELIGELRKTRPKMVIVGDYNIAHRAVDIHNPISNKNSSGYLPEERAWMDKFFEAGFTDTYRHRSPDTKHAYSWWSYRAGARGNNKGWRIDYISVTAPLRDLVKEALILPDVVHSDHCPVSIVLDL